MSSYYNPIRKNNLYNPNSKTPYPISRSKIDLFLSCPMCFYLDRKLGVARPPGFPFNLNSAVDKLLKKEFDIHRAEKSAHPLMEKYGLDLIPYQHKKIDIWRDPFKGIDFYHEPTNFRVFGGIDDVWVGPDNELVIVDYKATSKEGEVSIDAPWQICYKRQMEIYQWLFRQNGFNVSETGYFVYCNGITDAKAFDGKIEFDIKLIPYKGNTQWIEKTLFDIKECLDSDKIPDMAEDCDFCLYRKYTYGVINKIIKNQ